MPERGRSTPTFRAAPCARPILKGAIPAAAAAATPVVTVRRVTWPALLCALCVMSVPSLDQAVSAHDAGNSALSIATLDGKQLLDRCRNAKQAAILPVSGDQHDAGRQPGCTWQG